MVEAAPDSQAAGSVRVSLVDGPISSARPGTREGSGAVVCFEGVVRPTEDGRPLIGLDYTSYDPMAERELLRLSRQVIRDYQVEQIDLIHSRGLVKIGQVSLRVVVASAHRKPALTAVDFIIDALKREVPIWKTPVFVDQGQQQ